MEAVLQWVLIICCECLFMENAPLWKVLLFGKLKLLYGNYCFMEGSSLWRVLLYGL